MVEVFDVCTRLAHRVLRAIAVGLKLEVVSLLITIVNYHTLHYKITQILFNRFTNRVPLSRLIEGVLYKFLK